MSDPSKLGAWLAEAAPPARDPDFVAAVAERLERPARSAVELDLDWLARAGVGGLGAAAVLQLAAGWLESPGVQTALVAAICGVLLTRTALQGRLWA
jgi:hypothetical protein